MKLFIISFSTVLTKQKTTTLLLFTIDAKQETCICCEAGPLAHPGTLSRSSESCSRSENLAEATLGLPDVGFQDLASEQEAFRRLPQESESQIPRL